MARRGTCRRWWQRFWFRRWGVELREDCFERVEPWRIREGGIFERVPQMGYERSLLVIGKVERHGILDMVPPEFFWSFY